MPLPTEVKKLPTTTWRFLVFALGCLPWRWRWGVFGLSFFSAVAVVNSTYMLSVFKQLVDAITAAPPEQALSVAWPSFIILAICLVAHNVLYRLRGVVDMFTNPQTRNHMRELLFNYLLAHSNDYFHNRFAGELVNKINNVTSAYQSILWERFQHGFIPAFFALLASSYLLWPVSQAVVAVLWGVVALLLVLGIWLGPHVSRASAALADSESAITGQLVDTVGNIASVTSYSRQSYELGLLQRVQLPFVHNHKRYTKAELIYWGGFDVLLTALVLGFVYFIIIGWQQGQLTAGGMTLCLIIAWDTWYRMGGVSWNLTAMAADIGKMEDALQEIYVPHVITDSSAAKLRVSHGKIEFKNVNFAYVDGQQVFSNFNLVIDPAQRVGLIGLSGAGKTTLCQLLLRNYDIQGGQILIDGQDIAGITQQSLREQIAVIPQDPSLFHRSLAENITYGSPAASEAEIIMAATAAEAHEFIHQLPMQYHTMVGERGVKLSGGQRQRIIIARAILKNAPILLLDEATSALDSATERSIQTALDHAMAGRTTLVIAHRLSTLAHLDRLIVLANGQIVEDGTLTELLAQDGYFARLWRLQADGFLPEKMES